MTATEALTKAQAETDRLDSLAAKYSIASSTARAKAHAAKRKALALCQEKDDVAIEELFAESKRYEAEATRAHLCFVQVDQIARPAAVINEREAEIVERKEAAALLFRQGLDLRDVAAQKAKAAGLSHVKIDFTNHESQKLIDRSHAIQANIEILLRELAGIKEKAAKLKAAAEAALWPE